MWHEDCLSAHLLPAYMKLHILCLVSTLYTWYLIIATPTPFIRQHSWKLQINCCFHTFFFLKWAIMLWIIQVIEEVIWKTPDLRNNSHSCCVFLLLLLFRDKYQLKPPISFTSTVGWGEHNLSLNDMLTDYINGKTECLLMNHHENERAYNTHKSIGKGLQADQNRTRSRRKLRTS